MKPHSQNRCVECNTYIDLTQINGFYGITGKGKLCPDCIRKKGYI